MTNPWQRTTPGTPLAVVNPPDRIEVTEVRGADNAGVPDHPWLPMVIFSRLGASDDFTVVGGYPEGQEDRSIVRASEAAARAARANIEATPLPTHDPLYGVGGPLLSLWHAAAAGPRRTVAQHHL